MTMKFKFEKHIRKESRRIVRQLAAAYEIDDEGGRLLLFNYADADSQERDCFDIVNREGLQCLDRFSMLKPHSLLQVIKDCRNLKLAILKSLNLDLEPLHDRPGRPAGK